MTSLESASSGLFLQPEQDPNHPGDVNSAEKLGRYLELQDYIHDNFELVNIREDDLVEQLDDNPRRLLYRGMQPQEVFGLIHGEPKKLEPFHYDDEALYSDEPQNASYLYSNAIMHGYDRGEDYNFLAAVGFETTGMHIERTGDKMAREFAEHGEEELLPINREYDVSVEGVLEPEAVKIIAFRFLEKDKPKTLVFRRKISRKARRAA